MYGKRWCGSQVLCLSKPPIEKEIMVKNPGIKEGDRKRKRESEREREKNREGRDSLRCFNEQSNNRTYLTKNI